MKLRGFKIGAGAVLLSLVALFALAPAGGAQAAVQHPFMLVSESEYEEMRDRAASGTWKSMRTSVINYVKANSFNPDADLNTRLDQMNQIMNRLALAYVLDPDNASFYVEKFKTTISGWTGISNDRPTGADSAFNINCSRPYLVSILALDVFHNELTPQELTAIQTPMADIAYWYQHKSGGGLMPTTYAMLGAWNTYLGGFSSTTAEYWNNKYVAEVNDQINDGGIYFDGPGYAWARYNNQRFGKAYYMDVLTHMSTPETDPTGKYDLYSNPKIISFYEWLYGGASTPFFKNVSFGDTEVTRSTETWLAPFRAGQFSDLAGKNARWMTARMGKNVSSNLLSYVTYVPSAQEMPKSRVWAEGYAAFREARDSTTALAGFLWSPTGTGGTAHNHKDINAIHLSGYGENLLLNSGYAGWQTDIYKTGWAQTYTWNWIHDQAESSNTVLVNGLNHVSKQGGGVDEGFDNNGRLDYACGNSGPALSATHLRNLMFIHPDGDANGYWILFDEISADPAKYSTTQVLLHPNAKSISTIASQTEYRAAVNGIREDSSTTAALTMFLGTAPDSVTIKKGGIAAFDNKSFEGRYLYSSYNLNAQGKKNVVTVLFPEDSTHAKADMVRLQGQGCTGASIAQGNVIDFALEANGTHYATHDGVTFKALATVYRMDDDVLDFLFVRKGSFFDDGGVISRGFASDDEVTLFTDWKTGSIISPGTNVTFYGENIRDRDFYLNESLATVIASEQHWLQVFIPKGSWEYHFVPEPSSALLIASLLLAIGLAQGCKRRQIGRSSHPSQ